jgi:hypothetical protein
MELLAHTLREAKRLDLGVDLICGTGWPFGGPWVPNDDAPVRVLLKRLPCRPVAVWPSRYGAGQSQPKRGSSPCPPFRRPGKRST